MEKETPPSPSPFQRDICWSALSGIAMLILALLVCGLLWGMGFLFSLVKPILIPVIVAGVIAYLLAPSVKWVQKWVKHRIFAVLIVLFSSILLLSSILYSIIPPLVNQTSELIANREKIYQNAIATGNHILKIPIVQKGVDALHEEIKEENPGNSSIVEKTNLSYQSKLRDILSYHSSYMTSKAYQWLTAGYQFLSSFTIIFIGAVMVPIFAFYFLLKSESIVQNWHTIIPLRHSKFRIELVDTLKEINVYIVAFIRGQMLVSVIDGIMLGIALQIMGLPYAITIAAAACILGIIPYIGVILTSVPAILIAWFTWHDPSYVIAVAAIFITISQIDGWIIQPRIIGNSVGMHDMTIMFSVLFWGYIFGGILGALLAVPLTAALKVIFSRYVWTSFTQENKPFLTNTTREQAREQSDTHQS